MPPWGRSSALALPGVQPYVVVVAPRREEGRSWQAEVGAVGRYVEAQHVAVEGGGAGEVGDAQVDVSNAYVWMELGFGRHFSSTLWPSRGRVDRGVAVHDVYLPNLSGGSISI